MYTTLFNQAERWFKKYKYIFTFYFKVFWMYFIFYNTDIAYDQSTRRSIRTTGFVREEKREYTRKLRQIFNFFECPLLGDVGGYQRSSTNDSNSGEQLLSEHNNYRAKKSKMVRVTWSISAAEMQQLPETRFVTVRCISLQCRIRFHPYVHDAHSQSDASLFLTGHGPSTETVLQRTKFRWHLRVYRLLSISDHKKQLLCHTNENGNVCTVKPYFADGDDTVFSVIPWGFSRPKLKKKKPIQVYWIVQKHLKLNRILIVCNVYVYICFTPDQPSDLTRGV